MLSHWTCLSLKNDSNVIIKSLEDRYGCSSHFNVAGFRRRLKNSTTMSAIYYMLDLKFVGKNKFLKSFVILSIITPYICVYLQN